MTTQGSTGGAAGGGGSLHVVAANKVSRGRHRIVARRGEQPVHSDVFDPSDARRRGDFVKATVAALEHEAAAAGVAIQPGQLASVRGQLESQLLTLADELAAQEAQAPAHAQDDAFSNAGADGLGRMIDEIAAELMERTGGWPRRVGSALFCEGADGTPDLFASPTELFAWLRARFPVVWQRGPDKVPQDEFFAHLRRTAQAYDAIERVPHWPPRPGTYYMTPEVPPGDGTHLDMLLGVLNPATPVDRELIKAYLMTQVWGGAPGDRPHVPGHRAGGRRAAGARRGQEHAGHRHGAPVRRLPDGHPQGGPARDRQAAAVAGGAGQAGRAPGQPEDAPLLVEPTWRGSSRRR